MPVCFIFVESQTWNINGNGTGYIMKRLKSQSRRSCGMSCYGGKSRAAEKRIGAYGAHAFGNGYSRNISIPKGGV